MQKTGYAFVDRTRKLLATNNVADICLGAGDLANVLFEDLFLETETVKSLLSRKVTDCYVTVKSSNVAVRLLTESLHSTDSSTLQVSITPAASAVIPLDSSVCESLPEHSVVESKSLMAMNHPLGLANFSPHGLLLLSASFDFIAANNAFFEMTHLARNETQDRDWLAILSIEDSQGLAKALAEADWEHGEHIRREYKLVSPLGEVTWVRLIGRRVVASEAYAVAASEKDSGKNEISYNYILTFDDISQQKQSAEVNLRLANYDSLTGLANRRYFKEVLTECIRNRAAERSILAVLFIDLDGFKQVNDNYGHEAGDRLLVKMASIISDAGSRAKLVARLGGDEFTVLLTDVRRIEEVKYFASNLNVLLQDKLSIKGVDTEVSASIGIVMHHKRIDDRRSTDRIVNDLLRRADEAMYTAKNAGKNCHVFYGDYTDEATRSRSLLSADTMLRELSRAMTRDELFVEYQPQVETSSGRIVSCEALVRWRHESEGLIGPATFVPLMESSCSMGELTIWLIKRVCKDIRNSLSIYRHGAKIQNQVSVSVNLGATQIQDLEILEAIDRIITSESIPSGRFLFEITERTLISDPAAGHSGIEWLRARGYRVALDDFGTGYSSLAYLYRFALDEIKLDGSFIRDIQESHASRTVVNSMIELAHALGIRVTAEGVEQDSQLQYLRDIGCDKWQGYLMSAAISPADFMTLLRNQASDAKGARTPGKSRLFATGKAAKNTTKEYSYLLRQVT